MKALLQFVFVICFFSCGPVINYDYEHRTDFSQYKTYNFFDDIESGMSELDENRFKEAITTVFKAKGYEMSDTPDFFVDIQSELYEVAQDGGFGVGIGGTGGNMGGGMSVGIPVSQNTTRRVIILEFLDKDRRTLFWQAVARGAYKQNASPEKRQLDFLKLVDKILSGYPPKKTAKN
ncbi:DUF4136 domain-containing protein [Paucihalobacter ruber]|uniref:DUF4136 domain-containing protein n=1 Tax=Paucihalobacter ruber TaxID=2567861 RepID=A0A506PKM7_9FLAO|nr:DUF4136 domain-containing protein [Paucihalobacter ruber]TPV34199.1 DUF4136 domain-containing protein [Paucihalobacter ruber]